MYDSAQQASFWGEKRKWRTADRRQGRKGQRSLLLAVLLSTITLWMVIEYGREMAWQQWFKSLGIELTYTLSQSWPVNMAALPAAGVYEAGADTDETNGRAGTGLGIVGQEHGSALGEAGLRVPVVVIDAGHGGEDEGCSRDGVKEKDINLSIAWLVEKKLVGMGYHVIMTRKDDSYLAVEERVRLANESGADLYISIHQNASEYGSAQGIEVWYQEKKGIGQDRRLALLIGQQTIRNTGAAEREFQGDSQMYGVVHTDMPACLIETGFLSNKEERQKLVTAEYQEQIAQGIAQGVEYYFHPKTMYLTFDDGPFKENTTQVLDVLKERKVKATFFVVGEYVEKNPEVAKRIVEEGHAIGIHCYRHDYDELYASVDSYVEDFEKAHQLVREVTGVDTKIFRFPGGSINAFNKEVKDGIIQEMTDRGYIYYDWNASLEDAVADPQPQQLIANAVETTLGRKKVIMLAHDVVYTTGICLNDLLDHFPEYRMEILTPQVEPIQF